MITWLIFLVFGIPLFKVIGEMYSDKKATGEKLDQIQNRLKLIEKQNMSKYISFKKDELPDDWCVLDTSQASAMTSELTHEICNEHILYGKNFHVIARMDGRDDFLFAGKELELYVVHLTWRKEPNPQWPMTTSFEDKSDFLENWRKIYD
ncbi:MAG: hypothetical protein JKY19_01090 [Alcanivoracaceae bacterium]|nr:hypothetical protein [Alcanivoracaceae bacterium]